ncbi:hypothetical protein BC835DRAFT_1380162 [Cytidiella melzeri]|nr:hypothetical protein BC835DRAFT_1380162 [Cytidiella melzeri]
MRSFATVTFALIAIVGPAVSVPIDSSVVSSDDVQWADTSGMSNDDGSGAIQFALRTPPSGLLTPAQTDSTVNLTAQATRREEPSTTEFTQFPDNQDADGSGALAIRKVILPASTAFKQPTDSSGFHLNRREERTESVKLFARMGPPPKYEGPILPLHNDGSHRYPPTMPVFPSEVHQRPASDMPATPAAEFTHGTPYSSSSSLSSWKKKSIAIAAAVHTLGMLGAGYMLRAIEDKKVTGSWFPKRPPSHPHLGPRDSESTESFANLIDSLSPREDQLQKSEIDDLD